MSDFVGVVRLFAGDFVPQGYLACNGGLLPLREHLPLYSLIRDTFGGDGQTTFALPTLNPPVSGLTYVICDAGDYPPHSQDA